jgi:hypothetical protein
LPANENADRCRCGQEEKGPYPTTRAEHPDHTKAQSHRDSHTAQHTAKDGGRPPGRGTDLCW